MKMPSFEAYQPYIYGCKLDPPDKLKEKALYVVSCLDADRIEREGGTASWIVFIKNVAIHLMLTASGDADLTVDTIKKFIATHEDYCWGSLDDRDWRKTDEYTGKLELSEQWASRQRERSKK